MAELDQALTYFGISQNQIKTVVPITSGHINNTFKVETKGESCFILQTINNSVFKEPEQIAHNIRLVADHVVKNHQGYKFTVPVKGRDGKDLFFDSQGK